MYMARKAKPASLSCFIFIYIVIIKYVCACGMDWRAYIYSQTILWRELINTSIILNFGDSTVVKYI